MHNASAKSGLRSSRNIRSCFVSSSLFSALSLYRSSPSSFLRFSTLGPACHPGAFPVQAPDKAPETWTWSPGSEGGRQLARPRPRRQPDRLQAGQGRAGPDLDIETLQRLESLLADSPGNQLLVSRDRARLNDVAVSTLVIEDDGLVKEQQASHDGDLRQRPAEPACQSSAEPGCSREESRGCSP